MLPRKLTAAGLFAIVLACAGSLRAVTISSDWDRKKLWSRPGAESLYSDSDPDADSAWSDGGPELFTLKPRPSPKAPVAYQPPAKPQPKPRPKPVVPGATAPSVPGAPTPKPVDPPITRPS